MLLTTETRGRRGATRSAAEPTDARDDADALDEVQPVEAAAEPGPPGGAGPLEAAPPAPSRTDAAQAVPASFASETATDRPTAVIPLSWDGATWLFGGFDADVEGVFVATHDPLPVGTEADVILVLPDGARVAAHGVVALAKQADHDRDPHGADAQGDDWPGYGLRFTEVKDDGLDRLARLAERRHPLFYPA